MLRATLALAVTAVTALAAVAPAHAASGQPVFLETGGAGLDDGTRTAALDDLQSLGARATRVILYWRDVAPAADSAKRPTGLDAASPDAYDWGRTGRLVDGAAARGLRVLLTVSGPVPRWATESGRDQRTAPKPAEFRLFTTAVGRRFADHVNTWAIWNEPNHNPYLLPQYVHGKNRSGALYRRLFVAGREGLAAAGQGSETTLVGETAPSGRAGQNRTSPLAFLRETLCLDSRYRRVRARHCAPLRADGWAHHPYSNKLGPYYRPPSPDDVTVGVLSRLTRALDKAGRAGAIRRAMPIWLTEFGVQSVPDTLLGVSLARQAELRSLSESIAWHNPRVKAFSQYLLVDSPPRPGPLRGRYGGFESGLRTSAGDRKPAYAEFGLPLSVVRTGGGRVALWGLVRRADEATRVEVLTSDRGAAVKTAAARPTDARGVWTAALPDRAGRTWRVRWTAPGGQVYTGPPVRAFTAPRG